MYTGLPLISLMDWCIAESYQGVRNFKLYARTRHTESVLINASSAKLGYFFILNTQYSGCLVKVDILNFSLICTDQEMKLKIGFDIFRRRSQFLNFSKRLKLFVG